MTASDIDHPPFEMAFDRKIAEQKVRGKEETINEHLVKLLAFGVANATRDVWKKELRTHCAYLSALRLRPESRLVPRKDFFKWLYQDPFEGNEAGYVGALIGIHEEDFQRNARTIDEIAAMLRAFHSELADRLSRGDPARDLIASL
jgi:hypothetical protein